MKRLKVGLGIVGAGAFLVSLVSAPDLWWALILLAGASLGLGSFASEWLRRHQPATTPPPSDSEVNVPLTQSTKVADVELPSAEPGYSFRFSANVCYQGTPTEQHGNPAQLAAAVLLERVRELSRDYHPKEHTTAQYQLAAVLGKPAIDDTTGLTVWADNVVLTLDKEDLQRMRRLSSFDKDLRIWQQEQEVEQVRRNVLSKTLSSTAQILLWWLAQDSKVRPKAEEVREGARLVDAFKRMSETISGTGEEESYLLWTASNGPDGTGMPTAAAGPVSYQQACALIDSLPEGHHVFADRLANLLEWQGHEDTARRLRERYLLPEQDWDEPVAEEKDGSDIQETANMSKPSRFNGTSPFTPGRDVAPEPDEG